MRLVVHLSPDDNADVLSGRLWLAGAAGIEERPGQLIATFGSTDLAVAAHVDLGDLEVELREPPPVADTEQWRSFAEPTWVARDTVVVPTWWDGTVPDAALTIPLDPGRAFGFGHHPTTASLAARLRHRFADAGPSAAATVLDLGCGSGLLSIVAALSGGCSVVAVDIDPAARAATRSNIEINDVGDRITVAGATVTDAERAAPYDLIVANVPVGVHEEAATTMWRLLSPDAAIWATGITEDQVDRVISAHEQTGAGLVPVEAIDLDGEWWLVVLAAA